jgi:hypothetical protein
LHSGIESAETIPSDEYRQEWSQSVSDAPPVLVDGVSFDSLVIRFWDEHFLFKCNDRTDQIRLRIVDRKRTTRKLKQDSGSCSNRRNHRCTLTRLSSTSLVDRIYADISIPLAYATSPVYKQDVCINPQYPDSIIRIEVRNMPRDAVSSTRHNHKQEKSHHQLSHRRRPIPCTRSLLVVDKRVCQSRHPPYVQKKYIE